MNEDGPKAVVAASPGQRSNWLFPFLAVLLFFAVSGACGLLYQIVWTRNLVLLFGTTSYAVSTVLSVFFTGLGLGSLLGGRLADRSPRPLFWYGLIEIVVGLWAILFILVLGASESLAVGLLQGVAGSRMGGILVRAVLVSLLLIVPTTLMGATLPLLSRFVTRGPGALGSRVGALYTANTLGAVIGCAATGFVLIAALGYTRTTVLGAVANISVGVAAFFLSRAVERPGGPRLEAQADTIAAPAPASGLAPLVLLAFGVAGFTGLGLEVLWTRMLTLIFIGTTYAYTTMLASLLCGIAAGSAVASQWVERKRWRGRYTLALGVVQALTGLTCIAMLAAFDSLPARFDAMSVGVGREWASLIRVKFVASFTVLFLPNFLYGMGFPFAVRALTSDTAEVGRRVGRLYAANTLGGVLGAIAGAYYIIPRLGTHNGIVALGLLLFATGALLLFSCRGSSRASKLGWAAALAILAGLIFTRFLPENVVLTLNQAYLPEDQTRLHYVEGVEGTVAVSGPLGDSSGHDRTLWINAVQATATIEKGVKMNRYEGVLPFLFDRDPKQALFMCFGSGITAGTLGLWDFDRITAVEISADVLEAAKFFQTDNFDVLDNPKISFVVDDGRNFLLTTPQRFDVISFEPMPLALAGVSTFYTQEYYELCMAHLAPGGLVSQWVPLHSLNPEIVRALVRTFTSVFPEYTAWLVNADLFLIGSNEPLAIDFDKVRERWARPDIRAALAPVGLDDPIEMLSTFFMNKAQVDELAAGGEPMRDDLPWAEFAAPKAMYDPAGVPDSLRALLPLFTSPLPLLEASGRPPSAELRQAIERRYTSQRRTLDGVIQFYEAGTLGNTEDPFMEALDLDPENATARFYLEQIIEKRGELLLRWEEWDKGIEGYTRILPYLADEPLIHYYLGQFHFGAGRLVEAQDYFARYLSLGGPADRLPPGFAQP